MSDYKWLSSDSYTVSVSASGTIQAKKPGKATIKVVSIYDSLNYDEVLLSSLVNFIMLPKSSVISFHLFLCYIAWYLNVRMLFSWRVVLYGVNILAGLIHVVLITQNCALFVSSSLYTSFLSK